MIAVAALSAATVVSDEVDDFAGMDTSSANVFWDVSGHPMLTNYVASSVIADMATVDARRTAAASQTVGDFDSRFRTIGEADIVGIFRSNKPIGYYVIIR